jgi:hypothetical protein
MALRFIGRGFCHVLAAFCYPPEFLEHAHLLEGRRCPESPDDDSRHVIHRGDLCPIANVGDRAETAALSADVISPGDLRRSTTAWFAL